MPGSGIELVVLSYDGKPLASELSGCVTGAGELTVGRSPDNHLVLQDPERLVSRFQAKLAPAGADAVRVANVSSSSAILIDGVSIGPGESALMRSSGRAVFGRYVLGLRGVAEVAAVAPAAEPVARATIPADFDVFAVPQRPDERSHAPEELSLADFVAADAPSMIAELPLRGEITIDDPLASPKQQAPMLDTSRNVDPLALLGGQVGDMALVEGSLALDHGLEVDALFHTPSVVIPVAEQQPVPSPAAPPLVIEPVASEPPKPEPVIEQPAPVEPEKSTPVQLVKPRPVERPAEPAAEAGDDDLRAAFARGCGVAPSSLPAVSTEFMENLGRLFSEMTAGTVRLIHARSAAKHEMRAGVTIIATQGNNPLKFSPDGQSAIVHLLGTRFPGFMAPQRAIEDAFDDLAAHQVALLAGSRSAMYELVGRFSPERIERRCSEPSALESMLPALRRSRLWSLYAADFAEIAGAAREELETLLENAFARAYEQEIEQIYAGREQ
ncbi:type VI secretion system-associated FHA domain protein TagH [Pseudomonas sp. GD03985]|nr:MULTISPECIES: type VI secretion system-associated FHA domain protein TagH [unclassified Pseudomonas]MDH0894053.1 type VI secretion system-associated FHA domain protein TagH [Pseudomonas sp. GD03875]MDH1062808.1 type VI secretion system-associated FHA domain protein TagH [Pseudomonas sp. GD03985]